MIKDANTNKDTSLVKYGLYDSIMDMTPHLILIIQFTSGFDGKTDVQVLNSSGYKLLRSQMV